MPYESRPKLKPFYTYPELAKVLDISRQRVVRRRGQTVAHVQTACTRSAERPMAPAGFTCCRPARSRSSRRCQDHGTVDQTTGEPDGEQ